MYDHYFSNFGRPSFPYDICKDSVIRHPWFWRRRFLKVFTIYGHGGHLRQWTATILAIFHFPAQGRLQKSSIDSGGRASSIWAPKGLPRRQTTLYARRDAPTQTNNSVCTPRRSHADKQLRMHV